jgi:UPF0716 protein FxsA
VAIWLFLAFVALPIAEIATFIQVGGLIGVVPTLALVILAAVAGFAVMRRQGLRSLAEVQRRVEAGLDPGGSLAHGLLVMVAAILLILPGFLTDAAAIALLIRPVRTLLIGWGASRATVRAASYVHARRGPPRSPSVIDAEYEIVEDEGRRRGRPGASGWTKP